MYCSGTLWFYFGTCLNRSQKWLKEILKACWFFWKRIQVIHIFMNAKVEECSLFHRQHEITIFFTYFILQSIPEEYISFLMNFQIINLQSFQFCINILKMLVVQPHNSAFLGDDTKLYWFPLQQNRWKFFLLLRTIVVQPLLHGYSAVLRNSVSISSTLNPKLKNKSPQQMTLPLSSLSCSSNEKYQLPTFNRAYNL